MNELLEKMQKALENPGTMQTCSSRILNDLSTINVIGDGSCLWYALIVSVLVNVGFSKTSLLKQDRAGTLAILADYLRLQVCRELLDNDTNKFKDIYSPFWAPGEEGTRCAKTEIEYINLLRQGKIFAGALEIFALTNLSTCVVFIFDVNGDEVKITATKSSDIELNAEIYILLRENYHYDALYLNIQKT